MMGLLLMATSCREELLQTEQEYGLQSQKILVQHLKYDELQKKAPLVIRNLKKMTKVSNAGESTQRQFLVEDSAYINTDLSVYIEDEWGNKTFTFKIERTSKALSEAFLENLVLKDIGDGKYEMYMATYDQTAAENRAVISNEELKNHISFTYLGTEVHSEIFGKYLPDPCILTTSTYQQEVWIAPQKCYSGDHTFAQINSCNFATVGAAPPTPGYYAFVTSFEGTNVCLAPGGSGNTSGSSGSTGNHGTGGTTLPVGNGSGGTTIVTPCSKVKKPFTKIPTLAQKAVNFKSYTSDSVEHGFTVLSTANASTPNPYTEYVGVAGGVNVPTNPSNPYMIFVHTHSSPSEATYSVPSWFDLLWILQAHHNGGVDSNTVFVLMTADSTQYAITIDDWTMFEENVYALFPGVVFDQEKSNKSIKISDKYYYGKKDPNGNIIEPPKILENSSSKEQDLQYFLEMNQENAMGMNVMEVNADFTQFTKVNLNISNQIQRTPCN